ncbi:hypothetical protein J6590_031331 [Homalodisca vitripennis]|nr:hypothetical protein J6590_031331 [Homalodisca vitripennis]
MYVRLEYSTIRFYNIVSGYEKRKALAEQGVWRHEKSKGDTVHLKIVLEKLRNAYRPENWQRGVVFSN